MEGDINEWLLAMRAIGLSKKSSSSASAVNAPSPNANKDDPFDFNIFLQNNLRKIIVSDITQPEILDDEDSDDGDENGLKIIDNDNDEDASTEGESRNELLGADGSISR